MLFLVKGQYIEPGALLPPDKVVEMVENMVLPSLEIMTRWESEGAKGGVFAGERAGAWVLEAASAEEIGAKLAELPFWGLMHWDVKVLQSPSSVIARERGAIERMRERMSG